MAAQPQDGPCPTAAPFMIRIEGMTGTELFQAVTAHPEHARESFEEMRLGRYGAERTGEEARVTAVVADGHAPARLPFARNSTFALPSFRAGVGKRTKLGTQTVHFHVGSEETADFSIHESIIAPRSEFVRLALRGEWKEAKDRAIPLPTDEPATFAIYQEYLYTGVIFTGDLEAQEGHPSEFEILVKLYILGEKLMDSQLKDTVIDCIIEKLRVEQRFDIRLTDLVYEGTPSETSPLRILFMDIYYHSGTSDWLDESTVDIHEGFLADFSRYQMQQRNSFATIEAKYMGSPCAYHEHGDEQCYREQCPSYITPQTEFGKVLKDYVAPIVPKPSQTPSGFPPHILSGIAPPFVGVPTQPAPALNPFQPQSAGASPFQRCHRCDQSISVLFPTCRCHPRLPPQLQPDTNGPFTHQFSTSGGLFGSATSNPANQSIHSQLRGISDQLSRLQTSITGPPPPGLTHRGPTFDNPSTRFGDVTHIGAGFRTTPSRDSFGPLPRDNTSTDPFGRPSTFGTGGGLFGQLPQDNAGGGLFGRPSASATGQGLSGAPSSTQTASSLFGARVDAHTAPDFTGNNADTRTGSSLFGGNVGAQTGGNSLFGSSASRQPDTGLFGSQVPPSTGDDALQNDRPATTGLFGNPIAGGGSGSLFGNTAAQGRPSLSNSTRVAGGSLFSSTSLFGGRQVGASPMSAEGASGGNGPRPGHESPSFDLPSGQSAFDPGNTQAASGGQRDEIQ